MNVIGNMNLSMFSTLETRGSRSPVHQVILFILAAWSISIMDFLSDSRGFGLGNLFSDIILLIIIKIFKKFYT